MGRRLQSLEIVPDVIYTSSADRARSTARIIAEVLGYPLANIIEDSQWYLASAASWMNTIQQIPENTNTAMIFGHNPGMADLAGALNQTSDHLSFSPLSGAFFRLDADYWGEVTSGSGQLIEMLSPNSPQM
jgi:phosphohistidine phosphatase